MSDIKERLSALYDGELDSNDIDSVLEELEADNNLQKTLSLYSLIGLSLSNGIPFLLHVIFALDKLSDAMLPFTPNGLKSTNIK